MYKYVICEDDEKQADFIKEYVKQIDSTAEIQLFKTGKDLLENINTIFDDTIFLMDIVLPEVSGIDIAKIINNTVKNSIIIFISAFIGKALDVYDATHCYFILKPELEQRLPEALRKAQAIIINNRITLTLKDRTVVLLQSDILYIERIKRISVVHCKNQIYQCSYDVHTLQSQLSTKFIQTHRSFLVNLDFVKEFMRNEFLLIDTTSIPISRAFQKKVKLLFQEYLMNKVC